ncbi:MAG: alanine dehydrogenase [Acidimicrobiia bacterium]|nr:alanine dehydrogenase [Acidimicrobiia bacterium]MYE74370.1 alanine dehydrogenase [Acidimicrobiia bacterium]MYJ62094.1 alanine dehydrogenase [Acidimicrobiia bacterium]
MRIGVPKEIKSEERRVALTPGGATELVKRGHTVLVERGCGSGAGFADEEYAFHGAVIADSAEEVFSWAEMIVKVKEPQAEERARLGEHQVLFTYLHLAADAVQTAELVDQGVTAIAYESVVGPNGGLPLLAPMSQVAGRMSIQAGAHCLESSQGGRGVLLGGVPGVAPAKVVILGGGVVGRNATQMAIGLGADVTVIDRDISVLEDLSSRYGSALHTLHSSGGALEEAVLGADLVIGAVLVRGARAPHLVTTDLVKQMRPRSAVVDVAIDQGGCIETSRPTTHANPTYLAYDVVHYCVANMPGAVPRTSTFALEHATLPYMTMLADLGPREAMRVDAGLRAGLSVCQGQVTEPAVAQSLGLSFTAPEQALGFSRTAA